MEDVFRSFSLKTLKYKLKSCIQNHDQVKVCNYEQQNILKPGIWDFLYKRIQRDALTSPDMLYCSNTRNASDHNTTPSPGTIRGNEVFLLRCILLRRLPPGSSWGRMFPLKMDALILNGSSAKITSMLNKRKQINIISE